MAERSPHSIPRRPRGERDHGMERRSRPDRREPRREPKHLRYPGWPEQTVQFLTRYLFVLLGLTFFNFTSGISPVLMPLPYLNFAFLLYAFVNSALFLHASRVHISPKRFRTAMWIDIVITSISVLNDPYPIPPSLLVYIMVVLGNGMRYGMRLFREAVVGCFAAAMLVLSLRYAHGTMSLSPGLVFLNLFGGIILVYAYILMGRIERSRVQLEERSRIDPLTGLMNRRGILETADELFLQREQSQEPLVVMFADLDKFKQINDTYGHPAGDDVLRRFARILSDSLRRDDVAGRIGGDEFVMILPRTNAAQADVVARRIQNQINTCAAAHRIQFSATIGIGEAPPQGGSLPSLLAQVDEALYQAKAGAGRGGIMCAPPAEPA